MKYLIILILIIPNSIFSQVVKLKKYRTVVSDKTHVSQIEEYDSLGNLTSRTNYPENIKEYLRGVQKFKYNQKNQHIEDSFFSISSEGTLIMEGHTIYTYNEDGLCTSITELVYDKTWLSCSDSFSYRYKHFYSKEGKLYKSLYQLPCADTNQFEESQFYYYDSLGRCTLEIIYFRNLTLTKSKTNYNYDKKGNMIKEVLYYYRSDSLKPTRIVNEFKYNSKNKLIAYKNRAYNTILRNNDTIWQLMLSIKYSYKRNGLIRLEEYFSSLTYNSKKFYYRKRNIHKIKYVDRSLQDNTKYKKTETIEYTYY